MNSLCINSTGALTHAVVKLETEELRMAAHEMFASKLACIQPHVRRHTMGLVVDNPFKPCGIKGALKIYTLLVVIVEGFSTTEFV